MSEILMLLSPKLFTFSVFIFWFYAECLVVIPERANYTILNKKFFSRGVINIRRYNRRSPYLINVYGVSTQTFNNSFMVDVIFSQFLHNEYRRSFIEWHYKFCDMLNEEPFIGGMLKKTGMECPVLPGEHSYMNMTVPAHDFKYVWPFEKGRVDVTLSLVATKEIALHIFVDLTFKQIKKS